MSTYIQRQYTEIFNSIPELANVLIEIIMDYTRFAMSGVYMSEFDNSRKYNGRISRPTAINTDGENIFVCCSASQIQVFNKRGKYKYSFDKYGIDIGKFKMPIGIAISNSLLYVIAVSSPIIQIFNSSDGRYDSHFNTLFNPLRIKIYKSLIYILTEGNYISVYTLTRKFVGMHHLEITEILQHFDIFDDHIYVASYGTVMCFSFDIKIKFEFIVPYSINLPLLRITCLLAGKNLVYIGQGNTIREYDMEGNETKEWICPYKIYHTIGEPEPFTDLVFLDNQLIVVSYRYDTIFVIE